MCSKAPKFLVGKPGKESFMSSALPICSNMQVFASYKLSVLFPNFFSEQKTNF